MIDLNLVRTFVLLYQTGSATRTAETLFVTQPSVSHALNRLRKQFNDQLFTRSATGLSPTVVADRLYPPLAQALTVVDDAVRGTREFDPAASERVFRIRWTDLGELALLPAILSVLDARAARIGLAVDPLDSATAADDLRAGRCDAVISATRIDAPDLRWDSLFREGYLGLCAQTHPRVGATPTLAEYLGERHIAVNAISGHGDPDTPLLHAGLARQIAVTVSHFSALPELVARTHHLAVVPARVATLFTRMAPVRTFTLPVATNEVEVGMYTLRRLLPAPEIEWFRDVVIVALREG